MTIYFAYGANMDPVHMAEQCPGAIRLGLATLPEHEFLIAATGYGNAAPASGKELPGVLWELGAADEATLDRFEGVPQGLYRKESALVRSAAGAPIRAMLYRPNDPAPGTPVPGYLERIIEVSGTLGFPERYLASLRRQLVAR
jgi:AIG2 family protein